MSEKRIAWAITGGGHVLEQCIEALLKYENVDVFLSRAGDEVMRAYKLDMRLNTPRVRIYRETSASSPLIGRLFSGLYPVLVIAPATSNSVAKFVHGISDSLVTNLFAQAGKARVPIRVYPTDQVPETLSLGPRKVPLTVHPRPIDLENTKKLAAFDGVIVVRNREELEQRLSLDLA